VGQCEAYLFIFLCLIEGEFSVLDTLCCQLRVILSELKNKVCCVSIMRFYRALMIHITFLFAVTKC